MQVQAIMPSITPENLALELLPIDFPLLGFRVPFNHGFASGFWGIVA
jgi:hypothetical protein